VNRSCFSSCQRASSLSFGRKPCWRQVEEGVDRPETKPVGIDPVATGDGDTDSGTLDSPSFERVDVLEPHGAAEAGGQRCLSALTSWLNAPGS